MQRWLPTSAVLVLWFVCQASSTVVVRATQQKTPEDSVTIRATTASALRTWDTFVTESFRSGALRLSSVVRDPALPSRTVERFQQLHDGVPIWGADVVRDSERGVPLSIFGELTPELQLSTQPRLSVPQVRAAMASTAPEVTFLTAPQLVIVGRDQGDYRLAYTAVLFFDGDAVRLFLDAHTGAELLRYTELRRQQAAVGTGTGVVGGPKKLSVEAITGGYVAVDHLRPPRIRTYDLGGSLIRFIDAETGRRPLGASDLARDTDNVWTDIPVVDAQAYAGWTHDYYFKRFGRAGIDGRNAPLNIVVNALSQQAALQVSLSDVFLFALSANWCAPCLGGEGRLYFGNGIPPGFTIGGVNTTYIAGALDVVAHEYTHAVIAHTSQLLYVGESGALEEAFADMMSKGVEFFYRPPGTGVGQADYVFAKDSDRAVLPGALNGVRSLANPALYGQPDHYSRYRFLPVTPAGDFGGVHVNTGIPSHAFYLAIEGGTNRTSGMPVQGVGAGNRDQIEKVFYRAFTLLMPARAGFLTARAATIQAARDLYGSGSTVERAVTQAWDAVGVVTTGSMGTITGTVTADGFLDYAITMPETGRYRAVLNWDDAGADLDLFLSRPECISFSCMLAVADSATQRPETICWDVQAGELYRLWVFSYSSRAQPFRIQQSISTPSGPGTACPPADESAGTTALGRAKRSAGALIR